MNILSISIENFVFYKLTLHLHDERHIVEYFSFLDPFCCHGKRTHIYICLCLYLHIYIIVGHDFW
jgi:hypothetical protein